ncbi:MAG TPA: hypothetical protein VMB03_18790 [Bryobacteraceae bacterium]|nr:hypothetical protein [Bryobacteraceae bacterium]
MHFAGWALLAMSTVLASRPTDVPGIMARVAINQQWARDARASYLYRQEQTIRLRRPGGRMAREQHAEYAVAPGKQGVEKTLERFEGKYESKGKYFTYDKPGYTYKGVDIDGELAHSMSDDMMNDQKSQDGIGHDLFPLTAREQKKYDFRMMAREEYRGRPVYRVGFVPKKGTEDADWKGEALIDAQEYQPVMVETQMAEKIPGWVKVVFGTDIRGLGFSVSYQKFDKGVWFPVSYGGEFAVRGLFFYRRNISVAMQNTDFKKTNVKSTLVYATDAH